MASWRGGERSPSRRSGLQGARTGGWGERGASSRPGFWDPRPGTPYTCPGSCGRRRPGGARGSRAPRPPSRSVHLLGRLSSLPRRSVIRPLGTAPPLPGPGAGAFMNGRLLQVVGIESENVKARKRKLEAVSLVAAPVLTRIRSPGAGAPGRCLSGQTRRAGIAAPCVPALVIGGRAGGRPPAAPA